MHVTVVVADGPVADDVADLAAGQEGVARRLPQLGAEGELGGARLDGGVALAVQGGVELSAQGGVESSGLLRRQQLVAAGGGVRAGDGRLGDGAFQVAAQGGQGAGRTEAQRRYPATDLLPQFPGPERGLQLLAARAATHPYLAEVAQRGAAGLGLALDLYDLVAAFHCVPGVHGPHHAGSDDYYFHDRHAPRRRRTGGIRSTTRA